jgi:hypothetical protein
MVVRQIVGVVFGVVGAALLVQGASNLRTVYHVLAGDPLAVRDLHGRDGPVELEGTARAAEDGGTVAGPFTGTDCLACEYEVEEYQSSGKSSSWNTLAEGRDGVPFVVGDGTGEVEVDPEGAAVRFEEDVLEVDPGDELPEDVARFVGSHPDVDRQDGSLDLGVTELTLGNRQRFTERRLDVGEDVYVYGQAHPAERGGWGDTLVDAVVGDGEAAPVFVVSDTDERGTARRFGADAAWQVGLGVALVAAAAVALVPPLLP